MESKYLNRLLTILFFLFNAVLSFAQVPSFNVPDTVCVNSPVNITNTSTGATSYFWNFCTADLNQPPLGDNLGNPGGLFNGPVYIDYVEDNKNFYGFAVNNYGGGSLVRLDFGNSLLNTPNATFLGNINGAIPANGEGVQIVHYQNQWYVVVVGGDEKDGHTSSIAVISLGTSITNNSPAGVNWGNIDNSFSYPHDLYIFQDHSNWYGITVNSNNSTFTTIFFGADFTNKPSVRNVGNPGNLLNLPTGLHAIKDDNNKWHAFVTNAGGNTLTRLDFQNSLVDVPTAVNLGNPNGIFNTCWDIYVLKYCGNSVAYVINAGSSTLEKLDFQGDITNTPTAVDFGNIGNLNFPHCLSTLFRVGSDVYSFITNVSNNSLTRLKFPGCTNSSIPNSNLENPPTVKYSLPGTYNISLTIDDGKPTQRAYCKQVVVRDGPKLSVTGETAICSGDSAHLKVTGGVSYTWSSTTGTIAKPNSDAITVKPTATTKYYVTGKNSTGCSTTDSITVQLSPCKVVNASFTAPDTVCVNSPVKITNTSVGATSYYWNFCTADLNTTQPTTTDLGNPGGKVSRPVFIDVAYQNGNYYGFLINNGVAGTTQKLIRLDFGNSTLNIPTAVDLGNFDNAIPNSAEGIQMVYNNNKWYAIIVGGSPNVGSTPSILKIDFGANLTNLSPVAKNWGNIGNLSQPIDLFVFQEGDNWYGFTVNSDNNTITRFNFTNSFDNTPTAINLGNIGNLYYPTGVYAINDNGFWRVFVTNGANYFTGDGASLTRLDFGASLLNTPVGTNLGNPGGLLHEPRDITILKLCGETTALVVNGFTNDIVKLDFNSGLQGVPSATSFQTLGNLSFPHSLSKVFRVGADLYSFIPNVTGDNITRLQFSGCKDANILNSTDVEPKNVSYAKPGVYNINLTVDDGLPTQNSFCKQVVVVGPPNIKLTGDSSICVGDSAHIIASGGTSYSWLPATGISNPNSAVIAVKPAATTKYYVTVKNSAGCTSKDSITVKLSPCTVCDSWAGLSGSRPRIRLGDLDVAGHSITIEATFNRTTSFTGGDLYAGDLVSKHADPANVNYLLRPNDAEITTSNGYFNAISPCGIELNKTYHVAMTYDGTTLKFYRNGFLMAQTPATGDLYLNDFITTIGTTAYDLNNLNTDFQGFINEVRIWNVVRTQSQINQYMNTSLPNPANQTGLLAYYVFNNLKNRQGNSQWDAYIQDNATINATNSSCAFTADSCGIIKCYANPDFSFKQDVCNPKTIQFLNETTDVQSVSWYFGNNQNTGNDLTPLVTYNAYGTYPVKLVVTTTSGCKDSITKQVPIIVVKDDIITTKDTTLCSTGKLQLNAVTALSYCWTPSTGLSAANIANPVADISKNATYYLTSNVQGKNLIVNGDFSQGNTGFTSEYSYTANNTTEGQYYVGANPSSWNGATAACTDHTGSNGNMLLVNGNTQSNLKVWTETISIKPNTNYAFSAWLQPIYSVNPARLQFYINGKTIGSIFTASLPTCNWQQFYTTWNSGDTDKVTISIINKNTEVQGNDFALDDISFAESVIKTDSVVIKTSQALVKVSADTSICSGGAAKISAQVQAGAVYHWSPAGTLSNAGALATVATPAATTTYIINVTNSAGCKVEDSVKVTVIPQPAVTTIADTTVCSGSAITLATNAVNGDTYTWSPAQALTDAAIQSPVAKPTVNTQYVITVNAGNTCFARDTVNISVKPLPVVQLSNDTTLCNGKSVQLTATSPGNPVYAWDNAATLDNPAVNNPVASPSSTTIYHLQVTGANGCISLDSVTVTVLPQPAVTTIADTAICSGGSVNLLTSSVNGNSYSWSPTQGLSNASLQSPLASPLANTQYIITVNPGTLCFAKDTVNIAVNHLPVVQTSPDTTLCSGASVQLSALAGGNVSYSWSPQNGISNPFVNNPVVSPTTPTIYTVTVTDANKCSAQSSVRVNVIPQPVFAITPAIKEICVGDVVTLTASGGDIYQWSPAETIVSPSAATTQAKPLTNTTYNVVITNNTCKITQTLSAVIRVNDKLTMTLSKSNDVDCVQGSANLQVSGGLQYVWTPNTNISYPNTASPVVSPLQTTTYYVTGTKYGCKATDSITVYVSTANADNAYKMPSAFTPNGDNINDCFGLKYWGGVQKLVFEVFNRWGNRIFYTTDPSRCWDGTYKGQAQMGGTYVYQISAVTICGNIYKRGTVVLIR